MDGFLDVQRPWLAGLTEGVAHLGDAEAVGLLGLAACRRLRSRADGRATPPR